MTSLSTAQKILNGVMKYRHTIKKDLVKLFQNIQSNPNVRLFLFLCLSLKQECCRILAENNFIHMF
jgi:hypothetical protein